MQLQSYHGEYAEFQKKLDMIIAPVVNFTSSSYNASSLDIDFTPKFASSKVLVQCNFSCDTQASGRQLYGTIYRDSTRLDSMNIACLPATLL